MVHQMDGMYSAAARWDDPAGLEALFAPLPADVVTNIQYGRQQAEIRQANKGFRGIRHDAATERAFFVVADATHLLVWTFRPATLEEAILMWVLFHADLTNQITGDVAMECIERRRGARSRTFSNTACRGALQATEAGAPETPWALRRFYHQRAGRLKRSWGLGSG